MCVDSQGMWDVLSAQFKCVYIPAWILLNFASPHPNYTIDTHSNEITHNNQVYRYIYANAPLLGTGTAFIHKCMRDDESAHCK